MTSPDGDNLDQTVGRNALLHAARQRIDTVRYAIIIGSNFAQRITWTQRYANDSAKS
jgi:hypothetical protein